MTIGHQIWMLDRDALALRMATLTGKPPIAELAVPEHKIEDGIAVVQVSGTFVPKSSLLQVINGDISTEAFADLMTALQENEDVQGVVLAINSPGGYAKGIADAAQAVRELAGAKPVFAVTTDIMASAGYFIGSQATKVYATKDARVGSVGTRAVLLDLSKMYADAGVEPVVLDTGSYKSAAYPGTEITAEHREYFQGFVNATQEPFTAAVQSGRNLEADQLKEVLTGKLFLASQAAQVGLIDAVQSIGQTIASLREATQKQEKLAMSEPTTNTPAAPQPATFAELKQGLPGASPEFICEAQENNWTLDKATANWMAKQTEDQQKLADRIKQLETENETLKQQPGSGVDPSLLNDGNDGDGANVNAKQEWDDKVAELIASGKSRQQAVSFVSRRHPELRAQMLAAAN